MQYLDNSTLWSSTTAIKFTIKNGSKIKKYMNLLHFKSVSNETLTTKNVNINFIVWMFEVATINFDT